MTCEYTGDDIGRLWGIGHMGTDNPKWTLTTDVKDD